jgi:hypothetical protein
MNAKGKQLRFIGRRVRLRFAHYSAKGWIECALKESTHVARDGVGFVCRFRECVFVALVARSRQSSVDLAGVIFY